MRTPLCDELGIEFPIFAFTHCRDVVVAVSKAGGFGVLGAVGFTPEQLEIELNWIDEHIGDHTYGVDIVIPNKYEGMDANTSTEELTKMLQSMVPQGHLDFARKLLTDHGVPMEARTASARSPLRKITDFFCSISEATQRNGTNKLSKLYFDAAAGPPAISIIPKSIANGEIRFVGSVETNAESSDSLNVIQEALLSSRLK